MAVSPHDTACLGPILWQTGAMNLPQIYHSWIDAIGDGTGLADTVLHIHAGMAILLLGRAVSKKSLGTFVPWALVVLAEAGNEIMDRLYFGSWRWPDTLSDIGNTLFWPTLICLAVRLRPFDRPVSENQFRDGGADRIDQPS